MKRKIFWDMCRIALFAMVLATLLTTGLMCLELHQDMKQTVMTEVRYLESAIEVGGEEYLNHLASRGDGNSINRITWIGADGSVLYDSFADNKNLENHRDRPEVKQAIKQGRGESTRHSSTLAEMTYYYASRLQDGTVVRVASTTKSGLATIVGMIPVMLVLTVLIMGASMILADKQTKKIVEPINRLNPDYPQQEKVYDELSPLVHRLEKQKATIAHQMETLREKQEEFSAITENMKEGFIVVDSHADVISYNSSALRILGMTTVAKSAVKFAVLGGVLGAFIVVFGVCVIFLMSDKVYSAKELKNRYGVKILGALPAKACKCPIDQWLNELEGRVFEADEAIRNGLIAQNVRNGIGDVKKLLVVGSVDAVHVEALAKALETELPEITVVAGGNMLKDVETLKKLPECDGVVLVEACGLSKYGDIAQEIE